MSNSTFAAAAVLVLLALGLSACSTSPTEPAAGAESTTVQTATRTTPPETMAETPPRALQTATTRADPTPTEPAPTPTEEPGLASTLPDLGPAPDFTNEVWINTDGPLNLETLRGKVVLVEFWTFG